MFDAILTAFVARLATEAELRPQIVMKPLPGPVPYDAKTGVQVFVSSPQPTDTCGAGRNGYKVKRLLYVLCVTESLNDVGGRSDIGAKKHLRFEDKVINVAFDFFAAPLALGTAYRCMWVGGGEEMMKYVKLNPGLNGSVLVFSVEYTQTLSSLVRS